VSASASTPAELFQKKFHGSITTGALKADDNAKSLLVAAFPQFDGLTIKPAPGGKSGATVWVVTPAIEDRKRRYVPFLVKFNKLAKMQTERLRYEDPTQHVVPFRLHPRLDVARCKEDAKFGLLVFDFIDHALSFRRALRSYTPGQLIASLFDHTLGGCRIASIDLTGERIQSALAKVNVPFWSTDLEAAAAFACNKNSTLPSFVQIREIVNGLPSIPFRTGTVHGDLHTGNLLVAGGSTDVLLIDFGSIQRDLPLALDPACLEVSIAFCPSEVSEELDRHSPCDDEKWLRKTYVFPLDPSDVRPDSVEQLHIAEAVRAIRAEARKVESNPLPYALAIASYLFRYASYHDNGAIECRALAYELGCNLVLAVTTKVSL
jgi:hypothetical protein